MTDLTTHVSVRLDFGQITRLGPGKVRLLELIAEHGSISAAARAMGMSYRRAWLLVDSLNQAFRKPVIATRPGGKADKRAELTLFGLEVVTRYHAIQAATRKAIADDLKFLEGAIKESARPRVMRDPSDTGPLGWVDPPQLP